jgi:hypothetical protein
MEIPNLHIIPAGFSFLAIPLSLVSVLTLGCWFSLGLRTLSLWKYYRYSYGISLLVPAYSEGPSPTDLPNGTQPNACVLLPYSVTS